ncbi:unnamed protein product, partial [Oppiella nova]
IDWSLQSDNRETPVIKGVKQKYNVNDVLNVNCSTAAHDSQLKWFVNDDQVNSSQLVRYNMDETGHLVLGLMFVMEVHHFQMQELKLRCVAQFDRTIADFQEQVIIRTMNQEVIEAQSNVGINSTADNGMKPIILVIIM